MMTDYAGPFELVARKTLAALWAEADRMVHGNTVCGYENCPHKIDMCDLLEAVSRVYPDYAEDGSPPLMAN